MVPDAPVPWPWTRVAGRVWFAAGRLGSMRSRTSAQPCSMLAWWAPRHGGVAVPRQWRPSDGRTWSLARGICRFERVKGAGAGHSPRPGTSPNSRKSAVAPPAPNRAHGAYPAAEGQIPRAKRPVRPAEGFHCLATATPPCRRVHQAACCIAAQRCESASTPIAQLQTTPCPPPSSKAKVLDRPEPWKTRSDRAASSAVRLGPASSSSTLSWKSI